MAMTKTEVRRAFREAMAADYADVPAKDALNHTFSPEFCAKMDALIAEQKRGSWRLLSGKTRRALVVAAILAASLLLVACTPRLREAVSEFVVTVYETFVDFIVPEQTDAALRTEIETIYEFDPVPEGFEMVSQEQNSPYRVETHYINDSGDRIVLHQFVPTLSFGSTDAENANSSSKNILETDVWFASADDIETATFCYDGYRFTIAYIGTAEQIEIERLTESLLSTN